ncbi:MAG: dTMP kinase [Moorea sp. SIO2B7]|nr:dTMP kinase [Moorena sp. SIO2B7]
MAGKLIVFEGTEGGGKTSQMKRSHDWLKTQLGDEVPILMTREPGGTALGVGLRQILLEEDSLSLHHRAELLLYAADRAQHVEEVLKPNLEKGAIILSDRYTDSTIAYQGYGRGISSSLITKLNEIATGGLESDLTIWLDVDVETGLKRARKRGTADRMEQANLAFHQRVHQGFTELAKAYPQRIVRVDANVSEIEVQQQIQEILRLRIGDWGLGTEN